MSNSRLLILSLGITFLSFWFGYELAKRKTPVKVVIEEKEVVKEKEVIKADVKVIEKKTTKPDGTVIEEKVTEDKTVTQKDFERQIEKDIRADFDKKWEIGYIHSLNREYERHGVYIQKTVFGGIKFGMAVRSSGELSVMVGYQF